MSTHIAAKPGQIAETVLLPGDPLRAKYIAETYLENVEQYNSVRNMFGYTGTYKGKRVSVQGTGMGLPSIMIYANELITEYNVQNLIRVGSTGQSKKISMCVISSLPKERPPIPALSAIHSMVKSILRQSVALN